MKNQYTCSASTCNVLCRQTVALPLMVAMESTTPLNNRCLSSVASTTYVYKIFTYKLTCGRKIKSQLKVVSEPTRRLPNVTRRSHRIQYAVLLYLRVRAQTDDLPKRPQQNRAIRVRLFEMLVNTSERIRRRRRLTILLNDIGRLSIYAYLNRAQDGTRRVSIIQMKYRPVLRKICGTAVRAETIALNCTRPQKFVHVEDARTSGTSISMMFWDPGIRLQDGVDTQSGK